MQQISDSKRNGILLLGWGRRRTNILGSTISFRDEVRRLRWDQISFFIRETEIPFMILTFYDLFQNPLLSLLSHLNLIVLLFWFMMCLPVHIQ